MGIVNCCVGISRRIIGVINFIILVCVTAVGIIYYLKYKDEPFAKMITIDSTYAIVLGVVCSVLLCVIFGFFISCCENKCVSWTYFILLLISLILESIAIVFTFTNPDSVMEQIEKVYYSNDQILLKTRKTLERELECCGFDTVNTTDCGYNTGGRVAACKTVIEEAIRSNYKVVGIVLIVVAVIEFILLVSALSLVCIDEDKQEAVDITKL